ncbi:MAG: DNA polymerase III subunit delta [Vicinamibacterales bacterium]
MPVMTDAQAKRTLDAGAWPPILVVIGDDEAAKDAFIDGLSARIDAGLCAFNVERLYANEQTIADILVSARTLPLLGDRRVVLVLRADVFLKPKRKGGTEAEDEEADEESDVPSAATGELERYVASPSPETCLVLVAADFLRNTRLGKALLKSAVVVEYWGLKGDREMKGGLEQVLRAGEAFVASHVRGAGCTIASDAIEHLLEHAGTDINVLRNDVQRVLTYVGDRRDITRADVLAVVGGAVQIDDWGVTRAIQAGDVREALRHLRLGFDAGHSPYMVLGQLSWFVRTRMAQQAPARVGAAVESVFRTDVALKSSGGDPEVLLERLVVELCGGGRRG